MVRRVDQAQEDQDDERRYIQDILDDLILDLDANYDDYKILDSDWVEVSSKTHSVFLAGFIQSKVNDVHKVIDTSYCPSGDVITITRTMLISVVSTFSSSYIHILFILIFTLIFMAVIVFYFTFGSFIRYFEYIFQTFYFAVSVEQSELFICCFTYRWSFLFSEILGIYCGRQVDILASLVLGSPTEHVAPPWSVTQLRSILQVLKPFLYLF